MGACCTIDILASVAMAQPGQLMAQPRVLRCMGVLSCRRYVFFFSPYTYFSNSFTTNNYLQITASIATITSQRQRAGGWKWSITDPAADSNRGVQTCPTQPSTCTPTQPQLNPNSIPIWTKLGFKLGFMFEHPFLSCYFDLNSYLNFTTIY